MIKQEIYPKTQRVKCKGDQVQITEKLDGSNLVIFKYEDTLYIAQRKNIYKLTELEEAKDILYKGLHQWLLDNGKFLEENLHNNSAICGEWLGMGKLKYTVDEFDKRFYMFAKANVELDSEGFKLKSILYNHDLFIYPFVSQEIPQIIGIVPVVQELKYLPDKDNLDKIYETYTNKVNRDVEGFVVNYNNIVTKYVRMKNGKLQEHFDRNTENY